MSPYVRNLLAVGSDVVKNLERMLHSAAVALVTVEYPKYLCDSKELIKQCDEIVEWHYRSIKNEQSNNRSK